MPNNYQKPYSLPDGYLQGGYYDDPKENDPEEKMRLKPEYIVDYPKKIADDLYYDGKRGNINKRTQIRKYYEYTLRVKTKMEHLHNDFSLVKTDFLELLPYVNYARDRNVVTKLFADFIIENVDNIYDEKDFRAFTKHFEALIAYMKKGGDE